MLCIGLQYAHHVSVGNSCDAEDCPQKCDLNVQNHKMTLCKTQRLMRDCTDG